MLSLYFMKLVSEVPDEVHTALGDIPTNPSAFVSHVAGIAIGAGGIAAIGLVAAGAITILTSSGEPEKLMNGREMITNALMGLALIVLALLVLQFLGWDVLNLEEYTGVSFNDWL